VDYTRWSITGLRLGGTWGIIWWPMVSIGGFVRILQCDDSDCKIWPCFKGAPKGFKNHRWSLHL